MGKLYPFPQKKLPKERLRKVPVKIGAKILPMERVLVSLFRWQLYKNTEGKISVRKAPRKKSSKA
jgi:hypothetical protein